MNPDLIPGIVQDHRTGQVLMLGYLNQESLHLTKTTGLVHFFSRSRQRIWRKGETSGNTLTVVSIDDDCDGDALLIRVIPAGPACHTGAGSCFSEGNADTMTRLWETILARAHDRPSGSYTTSLLDGGIDTIGRKVIEEAVEVLLAARDHPSEAPETVCEEAADTVYHLLVLLAAVGASWNSVLDVLDRRASLAG
ncbi:MAG: bifunctional phosphoribosyl-AMP cyclohydrolase/phosphoribosyl-ATP diphosphatase HisIE [Actinomycetota bacterium]